MAKCINKAPGYTLLLMREENALIWLYLDTQLTALIDHGAVGVHSRQASGVVSASRMEEVILHVNNNQGSDFGVYLELGVWRALARTKSEGCTSRFSGKIVGLGCPCIVPLLARWAE
jgi:hypothetical protein